MSRLGRTTPSRAAAALLLSTLLFASAALASPDKPAAKSGKKAKSPTVDQIVGKYLSARGGADKLTALQTLRQEGRVNAGPGRDGLVMREIKRGGKIRFEFTVQGVTSVFASDGHKGWKVSPLEGEMAPKALPDEVLLDAREQADIDGPLVDWKAKGSKIELASREVLDGNDTYKLKITLKSGGVMFAYVDVKTSYLVKTEATRRARGREVRIETTFGDYKMVDGILFPHSVEVRAAGRPNALKIVVDKVEVNPTLNDSRFAMPPA
ncbi:MAG: hypothetical protein L6R30_00140 [Thermoanaerobaculia bacterium]|nr:hypothetical protein [Thermoanaerobaculia bacterium]